jgi:hypothetical protein
MNSMMQYITTDFDFESNVNLNDIVKELGEILVPQLNQWVDGKYCVSLSGTGPPVFDHPEDTINEFCDIIEQFSEKSMALWNGCLKRVADIGFESGKGPKYETYNISDNLI